MNCHDVREGLSTPARRGMGLTERALMHAHVGHCVDCRKEREALQLVASSPQRVDTSRALSSFTVSLARLRVLLSISLTEFAQAAMREIEAAWAGAGRLLDLLTRLVGLLPMVRVRSARTATGLVGHVRSGVTCLGRRLTWLRSSLTVVCRWVGRVAIEAARAGATRVVGLPTRGRWLLALLFTPPVQAAASVIRRSRFLRTVLARRLTSLRLSSMIAWQWAARAVIEAAGGGVKRGLASLTRLLVLVSIFFAVSAEAGGRLIAASRIGATWILGLLIQAHETTRDVGRAVVTTSGHALSHLGARTSALWRRMGGAGIRARPLLRVCTGIVSLAVLVAAIVFSWPPRSPPHLVDRDSALAKISAPTPVSAPQPAPVAVSRSETPRATVAVRPQPSGAQAEIPAPLRRSEPAPAQSRALTSVPMPSSEGTQNSEASDPTAAIDWLLKGGSGRQHIQNP